MKSGQMYWIGMTCVVAGMLIGCRSESRTAKPAVVKPHGTESIIVAGEPFDIGTRVVLWDEPGGYNAYDEHCHFKPEQVMPDHPADPSGPKRYESRTPRNDALAADVAKNGWTKENLNQQVDLFVIHYDACGTSRQCFKVLQDMRGLSVQFMLDLDGTIYQTLDCKERAWHAGSANDRAVGIEIANIGAYRDMERLDKWYGMDADGWPIVTVPEQFHPVGQLTKDFVARSARKEVVEGFVNSTPLMQYDYTVEQYDALTKLTAGLARAFPKIKLALPMDEDGEVLNRVLTDEEVAAFEGVCGHSHVWGPKVDPGPAFDWKRVVDGAKAINDQQAAEATAKE